MKAYLDCVVCQQQQALRILRLITDDANTQKYLMRQVMERLATVDWETDPMTIAKGTFDFITHVTGTADPYEQLKYQSNQDVLEIYPKLQRIIRQSDDPLFTACKLAVAGNIMDFGANLDFNIHETIQHVLDTDFTINQYAEFKTALGQAGSLLLFADNAGEIVFDKLLLETILSQYPKLKLTVVVKKRPILNDATLDDAQLIGLTDLPRIDFQCVNTNGHEQGAWMSPDVKRWIQQHDLVISKGQANYEVMSEVPGLYFLLIAKCAVVAKDIGTHTGALIFKQREGSNS